MWCHCLNIFQVRDEVEHLLDHNENMAQLHLSRKQIKSPQDEALLVSSALNCNFPSKTNLDIRNSVINQATGIAMGRRCRRPRDVTWILFHAAGWNSQQNYDGLFFSPKPVLHTPYSPPAFSDYDSSYPHVDNYFLAYLTGPRIYRWHWRLHQHPTWQPTQWTYSAPSHTDYCILWHIHEHIDSCIVCHKRA